VTENPRPSGLWMTFVVGGMLLALALLAFVFMPVDSCSLCKGEGRVWISISDDGRSDRVDSCSRCRGKGRVPLLKRWNEPNPNKY
jgi:hypothetical protein